MTRGTYSAAQTQTQSQYSQQPVQIIRNGDHITMAFDAPQGQCEMTCTGSHGGRIISFRLDGHEILVAPNESGMFGSTFWTSPENWGWPPPAVIDENPYKIQVDDSQQIFELTSEPDASLGIRVQKRFAVATELNAVHVDYTIINTSDQVQRYAPWEISRVEKGGVTFYRPGNEILNVKNRGVMKMQRHSGISAYHHPTDMTDDAKLFDCSADGWIAHTDGRMLLIKQFDPCTQQAPGEGDIEIYACPNYVEVEQQGTYSDIFPKNSTTWRVTWSLHRLSENIQKTDLASLLSTVDNYLKK
ncbi:MAG: hypothetical protein JXX14_16690 [Deltaproteobacteria bacterium]|nr:hypothetical protein [Deltaproteobacteria bacterium]